MADVTTIASRHRITFTPAGGKEIVLLDVGDDMDSAVALTGGPQVSATELIAREWMHHTARGNAEAQLIFDLHRRAGSPAAAQAYGLRMWRYLTTHPEGTLRFQTAFVSGKSCPMIDWQMAAICNSVEHADVDIDSSPFERAASCHLTYTFSVNFFDTIDFDL